MSKASKYTTSNSLDWGIDSKKFPYADAKTLDENVEYPCYGIFFVKGKYKEHPVIISDGVNVSFPEACNAVCKEVVQDIECVDEIKSHLVKFKVRKFKSEKYNTESCTIIFI